MWEFAALCTLHASSSVSPLCTAKMRSVFLLRVCFFSSVFLRIPRTKVHVRDTAYSGKANILFPDYCWVCTAWALVSAALSTALSIRVCWSIFLASEARFSNLSGFFLSAKLGFRVKTFFVFWSGRRLRNLANTLFILLDPWALLVLYFPSFCSVHACFQNV